MVDDKYEDTIVSTPRGGNISPLLANIMLNELDKELGSEQHLKGAETQSADSRLDQLFQNRERGLQGCADVPCFNLHYQLLEALTLKGCAGYAVAGKMPDVDKTMPFCVIF